MKIDKPVLPVTPPVILTGTPNTAPAVSESNTLTAPTPYYTAKPAVNSFAEHLQEAGLSADMIEVLVTLLRAMSASRKARQEAWYADTKAGFEQAILSAVAQRQSAQHQFTSDMLTHSFALAQGAVDVGSGLYGMKKLSSAKAKVQAEADKRDFGHKADPSKTPATDANAPDKTPQTRPENEYESIKEMRAKKEEWQANSLKKGDPLDEGKGAPETVGKDGKRANSTPPETDAERMAREEANQRADLDKEQWISNRLHEKNMAEDRRSRLISAVGSMLASAGHIGGAVEGREATLSNAEATALRAFSEYLHSLASTDADWYAELQAQFKAVIQSLQAIDSARHQANTQIWS